MVWHKRSLQLIISFPLAFPMLSHAVNVGETYIQSGQNEPLNASINVSDIDPKTFSVKVATPEMYKQLGLSDEQAVSAKFEPTSSNGGKIVLTTAQPVATPYADVVLNIENKGEKNLLPKTLLMPINGSQQVITQPQTDNAIIKRPKVKKTIAKNTAIDLPTATAVPAGTPLVISTGAPPDLAMTSAPTPAPTATVNVTPTPNANSANTTPTSLPSATPANSNATSSNLTIQETRHFTPITNATTTSATATPSSNTTTNSVTSTVTPPNEKTPDTPLAKPTPATKPVTKTRAPTKITPTAATDDDDDDTTTYIIQRNDNLWTIASRVAKSNHKNVHQVMQDIIDENPDAFENGDPTRMVANTELEIPNYETTPSAAGIKAAKRNRTRAVIARAAPARATAEKPSTKKTSAKGKSHGKKKSYQASHATTKTHVQTASRPRPASKARLNIISANQSNGNAQGKHQSTASNNHGTNSQLIDQVKQKREATAGQASRVNQLSGALSSSEQKLKLQNEKLAMLEKRLKELNKS